MPALQPILTTPTTECPLCGMGMNGFDAVCAECGGGFPDDQWSLAMGIDNAPIVGQRIKHHYNSRIYRKGDMFRVLVVRPSTEKEPMSDNAIGRITIHIHDKWLQFAGEYNAFYDIEWFFYDERGKTPPQRLEFRKFDDRSVRMVRYGSSRWFFAKTDPGNIPGDPAQWKQE